MKRRTPLIAGLCASALVAVLARPGFALQSLPLYALPVAAATYVLTVLIATALVLLVTYFIYAQPDGFYPVAIRTASAAVWAPPLVLLFYWRSPWAVAAAAALAWDTIDAGDRDHRRFLTSLGVSASLQLALVAGLMGYMRVAALLAGTGAAVFLWALPERRAQRFTLPRALPRVTLAILLTMFALTPYLKLLRGADDGGLLAGAAPGHGEGDEKGKASKTAALGAGQFPGVILWPEKKLRTRIVSPPPTTARGRGFGAAPKPMVIPFDGVYWFFHIPDRQPPPNSTVLHGSTMKTIYRSVNPVALQMEAHQNLGALMELSCCRRIEVVIDNADPSQEWVALELLLADTALPALPPVSLGRVAISGAAEQTLTFAVPGASVVRQFDRATVRFHRGPKQWAKSVKVAIVRFVLVP